MASSAQGLAQLSAGVARDQGLPLGPDQPVSFPLIEIAGAVKSRSPSMRHLALVFPRVANSSATVLITGENGTGKTLIAEALHNNGLRSSKPFASINCGSIPHELLESELFGHEKGSFTGASKQKIGRFEAANNGTIFLDEIGDLAGNLQVKLLRILQEKTFERVGGSKTIHVDVRVMAATNRNLKAMVDEGDFREDLYYRLRVVPLHLPSLRDREQDILPLAEDFLKKFKSRDGRLELEFLPAAREVLQNHRWPGNVRELENLIEGLVVTCEGPQITEIEVRAALALDPQSSGPQLVCMPLASQAGDPDVIRRRGADGRHKSLDEIEQAHIEATLREMGGDKLLASRALGISRSGLYRHLRGVADEARL